MAEIRFATEKAGALVVSAPGGLVLAANAHFCEHSGYSEAELLGQPLRSLQPATAAGCLVSALEAQQAGCGFSVHEVPLLRKNGMEERATIRASPLYCVESGALQGFSLLMCAYVPANMTGAHSGSSYASPAMPAASVEGLRNVAPSVLRLLQIGGDEPWDEGAAAAAAARGAHHEQLRSASRVTWTL